MSQEILLDNGRSVRIQGRPAQGTRHTVLFGALPETAEPVVIKLERMPGALVREQRALNQLAADGGPVPRLITAGMTVFDGERRACLVTERRPGKPPTTDDGWRRMGRALARIGDDVAVDNGLPVLTHALFGHQHARRIGELGDRLAPVAAALPDWELLASAEVPRPSPLALTHGDPGPGNFLDDGGDGTIIDWEEAHVAPRGLDLARLVFIALLGSGPDGFRARDQQARARAVVAGYLATLGQSWRPSVAQARWWIAVAGVQFVHRRWQLGGRPGPWEQAADVLQAALAQTFACSCVPQSTSPPMRR